MRWRVDYFTRRPKATNQNHETIHEKETHAKSTEKAKEKATTSSPETERCEDWIKHRMQDQWNLNPCESSEDSSSEFLQMRDVKGAKSADIVKDMIEAKEAIDALRPGSRESLKEVVEKKEVEGRVEEWLDKTP